MEGPASSRVVLIGMLSECDDHQNILPLMSQIYHKPPKAAGSLQLIILVFYSPERISK